MKKENSGDVFAVFVSVVFVLGVIIGLVYLVHSIRSVNTRCDELSSRIDSLSTKHQRLRDELYDARLIRSQTLNGFLYRVQDPIRISDVCADNAALWEYLGVEKVTTPSSPAKTEFVAREKNVGAGETNWTRIIWQNATGESL